MTNRFEKTTDRIWGTNEENLTMKDLSWVLSISPNLAKRLSLHEMVDNLYNLVDSNYNGDDEQKNREIEKYEKLLPKYIDAFDIIIINKLYDMWYHGLILDNIDSFKWKIDDKFTIKLIHDWYVSLVLKRIYQEWNDLFNMHDSEIIDELIKNNQFKDIIENISLLIGSTPKEIIVKVIDNWWWYEVCEYLTDFSMVINIEEIINKLLDKGISIESIKRLLNRYKESLDKNTVDL